MANHLWSKFVWSDWANDPALKLCSLAAQGLWMRLLCIAHDANPRGHVLVNGRKPTDEELVTITGIGTKGTRLVRSVYQFRTLVVQLIENGVCSQTADGVLVSRRMVRDEEIHERAVNAGKKGGNPNVRGPKKDEPQVNQEVKPQANGVVNPDSYSLREDSIKESPLSPPRGAPPRPSPKSGREQPVEFQPEKKAARRGGAPSPNPFRFIH
jgi:hypothetical protein